MTSIIPANLADAMLFLSRQLRMYIITNVGIITISILNKSSSLNLFELLFAKIVQDGGNDVDCNLLGLTNASHGVDLFDVGDDG